MDGVLNASHLAVADQQPAPAQALWPRRTVGGAPGVPVACRGIPPVRSGPGRKGRSGFCCHGFRTTPELHTERGRSVQNPWVRCQSGATDRLTNAWLAVEIF